MMRLVLGGPIRRILKLSSGEMIVTKTMRVEMERRK